MTHKLMLATSAATVLLALTLTVAGPSGSDEAVAESWGSSLVIRDPDPGFWRSHPGDGSASAQLYSAGLSSLAAMTRIGVAPGDDLELTNLAASGAMVLESGALVLTNAEGLVALQRGGEVPGLDAAPIGVGSLLVRGDRIVFRSTATMAFRNADATTASLLLTTEISALPVPTGGIAQ